MATGYEQARSVVAALAGDWAAARDVQLDLPETGVCSSSFVTDDNARIITDDQTGVNCCATAAAGPAPVPASRGLATGIAGGLLSAPLTLLPVAAPAAGEQAGGCCG